MSTNTITRNVKIAQNRRKEETTKKFLTAFSKCLEQKYDWDTRVYFSACDETCDECILTPWSEGAIEVSIALKTAFKAIKQEKLFNELFCVKKKS